MRTAQGPARISSAETSQQRIWSGESGIPVVPRCSGTETADIFIASQPIGWPSWSNGWIIPPERMSRKVRTPPDKNASSEENWSEFCRNSELVVFFKLSDWSMKNSGTIFPTVQNFSPSKAKRRIRMRIICFFTYKSRLQGYIYINIAESVFFFNTWQPFFIYFRISFKLSRIAVSLMPASNAKACAIRLGNCFFFSEWNSTSLIRGPVSGK